jgi:hypothetical protein
MSKVMNIVEAFIFSLFISGFLCVPARAQTGNQKTGQDLSNTGVPCCNGQNPNNPPPNPNYNCEQFG